MRSINVLTISEESEGWEGLVRIVEAATNFFPSVAWDSVEYVGKISLEHDVKITAKNASFGAFLLENLIQKIKRIKNSDKLVNLLLGLTSDPIVAMYYFFDGVKFKRESFLVHDYVTEKVGVVSLFHVEKDASSKVVAHGLGHNKGLRHHIEPIDLMYSELLKSSVLRIDGFCKGCLHKLAKETWHQVHDDS